MSLNERIERKNRIDNLPVAEMPLPDFLPREVISSQYLEAQEEAIARLKSNAFLYSKISARTNPQTLIIKLVDTVARFEKLVLFELKLDSSDLDQQIDPIAQRKKISELEKELAALKSSSNKGRNVVEALKSCETDLTRAKSATPLSSEQEAKYKVIIDKYPAILSPIKGEWFKREKAAPRKKYRDQLINEVFNLFREHASNAIQMEVGRNIRLTSEIIPILCPAINTTESFKEKDIENALYK